MLLHPAYLTSERSRASVIVDYRTRRYRFVFILFVIVIFLPVLVFVRSLDYIQIDGTDDINKKTRVFSMDSSVIKYFWQQVKNT